MGDLISKRVIVAKGGLFFAIAATSGFLIVQRSPEHIVDMLERTYASRDAE